MPLAYGYDGADQLTSETSTGGASGAPPTLGYTYDSNGNRKTQTQNGQPLQSFTYDAHDKLTSGTSGSETDSYDAMGSETSTTIGGGTYRETYDDEDRLTSLTTPGGITDSFTYNGLGLRVTKTDSTGSYAYVCDGTSAGSPVLTDGAALYTPGLSENRGRASRYYSNDKMGNLWTIDGSSKSEAYYQDTTGFGTNTATSGAPLTPFGYGGGNGCQTDADTGLILMGHRYFDTRIGRFISQDPIGDGDNWYAYAGNSPTNEVDPEGLDPSDIPGFQGQPTGFWPDGEPYFVPNGGPETSATPDDPSSYVYDLDSYGYTGGNGPNTEPASQGGEGSSGTDWAGEVDNWVTFGTVTNAGNVAGLYDSGKASRGAAIAAGALAVGAVLATGGSDGADVEAEDEFKAEDYLTTELIKKARNIPIKQGEGLARDYSGKASNWLKKSTEVFQHPGTGEDVEIHWFQNTRDNIGKILIKWKFDPYE